MSVPVGMRAADVVAQESIKAESADALVASPSRLASAKRAPPTTPAHVGRPRRAPEHISCRDLGKYVDGVDVEITQREAEASRTERKSKTQALSAMARHGESATEISAATPHAQRHATRKSARMTRVPSVVYDYMEVPQEPGAPAPVATAATTPRHAPRTRPRVFGLEEAPTFYPTWEEFQDPMAYIDWTAKPEGGNGFAYGIVKIVPPEGWKMDFVLDEQLFRFRTRVQRLNELSAEGRVSQNYLEQLEQFHAQQGHGRVSVPRLGGRPLDLYAVKLAAHTHPEGDWQAIAHALGYDDPGAPGVLKNVHARLVAPFEAYLAHARQQHRAPKLKQEASQDASRCEVCRISDSEARVQCSDCERHFHLACVSLPHVPRGDWICSSCLMGTGGDFGFDDGETHSLHSFWQRCAAFQRVWAARAAKRSPPELAAQWERLPTRSNMDATLVADEDLIEAEFWRLVHSNDELVDVEYGADVHSSTHGNASPSVEGQPLNPYSRSGWNLNNLPILPGSLLRYIKSEISGMTIPWIYIGMMFSAFCWHNEDHYTYSVNYQHWGATKTWYGVPGDDAAKFEAAMQHIAPELFEACPDLLLQLVTMMSPELCQREGVRTYACNQRPNEFVLTFPKAYHSGFNHGFNLNEAVNFVLPNWVMDGLACVKRYQTFARQPVFSHDELLVTVALHNQQLPTAVWLQGAYRDMVHRERHARNALRALHVPEELAEYDRRESEYQCNHCKTLCYLSQVVSRATQTVACPAHAADVHGEDLSQCVLRLRFSDHYLETQANKLTERAAVPHSWQERVRKLLLQHPRPPLRTLRALVQEGEKIVYPLPELEQLHAFLQRAEPWVQRAQVFLTRRQKRSEHAPRRRGRARETAAEPPMSDTPPDRSPEALLQLCAHVPTLPFDTPEFASLAGVVEQMDVFRREAGAYLASDPKAPDAHHKVDDAERVLGQGALLQVDVPELAALRRWIAHAKWFSELHEIGDKFLSLEEVHELLAEAAQAGISDDLPEIQGLHARRQRGEAWGHGALALLEGSQPITRAALDQLLEVPAVVATATDLRTRVTSLQHKAAQWHETVADIYSHTHPTPHNVSGPAQDPPRLAEARQVLADAAASRINLPFADELAQGIALHDKWNAELAHILRKALTRFKGVDPVESARRFCEHTARAAAASALAEWEEYMVWKAQTNAAKPSHPSVSESAAPRSDVEAPTPTPSALESTCSAGSPASRTEAEAKPHAAGSAPAADPAALAFQGPTGETRAAPLSPAPAVPPPEPPTASAPPSGDTAPEPAGLAAVPAPSVAPDPSATLSETTGPPAAAPDVPHAGTHQADKPSVEVSETKAPPAPCICFETLPERTASICCAACGTLYHLKCLDLRPKGLSKPWTCPFCDKHKLTTLLQTRHAVSQLPLVALLQNAAFQRDKFRFLPSNYIVLQAAIRATVEFGVAVTMRFRSGALPSELMDGPRSSNVNVTPLLREVTRRAVGCPVDVLLIADATPKHHVPSVLDALLPAFQIQPPPSQAERKPTPAKPGEGASRPARRSKRARLTFREEKLPITGGDAPVHCFCGQPDTGTMVQCDKCSLWFHNACMCIDDPEALQDKWFCPVCCLRLRRRYPYAEVRIVDATPSAPHPPLPPNYFVDVHASLRSETTPVHKVQHWTNERRILLHLVHFEPAVLIPSEKPAAVPPPPGEPPAKRARLSPEHDRHLAGRLNLLRRGVSEAMMQRYAMGWNGEAIVCQLAPDRQVLLGPSIRLAPDDLDGTRLLRMALEAAWRPERETPYGEARFHRPLERGGPGAPHTPAPSAPPLLSERPTHPGHSAPRPPVPDVGRLERPPPHLGAPAPPPMSGPLPRPLGDRVPPFSPRDPLRPMADELRRPLPSPHEELRRPLHPEALQRRSPIPPEELRRHSPMPLPAFTRPFREGPPMPSTPPSWHP